MAQSRGFYIEKRRRISGEIIGSNQMPSLKFPTVVALLPLLGSCSASGPEEIEFESEDAVLSGSLFFPESNEPIASIVLVHGAGPTEGSWGLAERLASEGFAVLTYDKRGVGESGGTYEGEDNVNAANLRLLAADAAAAVRVVLAHPRLADVPSGIFGVSQAGWIGPIAATDVQISFLAFASGPVNTVSESLRKEASAASDATIAQAISQYADRISRNDTDPRDYLIQLDIPGLWMYGQDDVLVPVELSIERLQEMIREGHEYQFEVFPGQGHNFDVTDPNTDPDYRYLVAWIRNVVEGI